MAYVVEVSEVRVYVDKDAMEPIVGYSSQEVCTAKTIKALAHQIKDWMKRMDLSLLDISAEDGTMTVEKLGLVMECSLTNDGDALSPKDANFLETELT